MNKEAFTNKTREELISGAIREFKSVIDFYRMEYSENLILLFNDLGYLLLCRLIHEYGTIKKWKRDNSDFRREGDSLGVKDFSLQSAEEITSYLNKLEYNFRVATEYEDQLAFLKNYKLTIKKNSVMRPILEIVNELYELQDRSGGTDLLYDAVQRILELCINNKAEKSRYILPDEIIKYLAQILDAERKFTNTDRKVSILDPQYSSGNMLTAASGYFKNSQLYGFESDNSLKISAQILFILANIDVNTGEENFLTNRLEKRYDIVLANPSFTNDPVPENSNVYEPPLPEELGHINGKYNLFIVRTLQALETEGRSAIIVPDNFLFSSKKENMEVRKWILNTYLVEAILSLPQDTFFTNATVASSILIISNPMMLGGWKDRMPYLFFYQMKPDNSDGEPGNYDELLYVWNRRNEYYKQWVQLSERSLLENYNNIKTPEEWDRVYFWFADRKTVKESKWNMLPGFYQPPKRPELEFEAPEILLHDVIQEQKELLEALEKLLEEVESL